MAHVKPRPLPAHYVHSIPFDGPPAGLPAKAVVGSKAHNLMRMAQRQLPVPPGFVLSTDLCRAYLKHGAAALEGLDEVLCGELAKLGRATNRIFGDAKRPLLVSVRSGAAISMPGMMETILNIGLTPETLPGLLRMTGNPRLAQDCRRRLAQQYGEVVYGIAPACFEQRLKSLLCERGASAIDELGTAGLEALASAFEDEIETQAGWPLPTSALEQLRVAVEAVLRSWSGERARSYRELNGIDDDLGTAITIQSMAFGNLGPTSGAGVGFTRNPATGANELFVDYLANAQGEDVVAGRCQAMPIEEMARRAPAAYQALIGARAVLEAEFGDMQDFEFTVEDGHLLMLQARAGKRTPLAALRIARDLGTEGVLSREAAVGLLADVDLAAIEEEAIAPDSKAELIGSGTPAGIGIVTGAVVFDPDRLADVTRKGASAILVRPTADTGDIAALAKAAALVTIEGARTSHAAVVARQLGKACVVACSGLSIDVVGGSASLNAINLNEGDTITVDGATGAIYRGELKILRTRPQALLDEIAAWSGEATRKSVAPRRRKA